MIHVVLCQPEIPQNTGNIMRTCVGTGVKLHLIEPLGFKIDDKKLRRSAVDYYDFLNFEIHPNFDSFKKNHHGTYFYLSRYGKKSHSDPKYNEINHDIYLVFGSESYGIDRKLLSENESNTFRIPTNDKIRSLNLSNAVAITVFEVLRQLGYPDLYEFEPDTLKGKDYLKNFKE
ncbi:tRNA (cytidine(34)-2'-O)-methyltransferase [Acholeplasma granularum]|uniref:tRNA (cytidine(34)-2'-O)-methyltransferase n=1 Tax=Acholeplasma granularum TaxID=264635 RepID=UPI0004723193|nr:tRNA (cytidine(34)-2'-O)-methyltransferase [Acholeplasma granularum]